MADYGRSGASAPSGHSCSASSPSSRSRPKESVPNAIDELSFAGRTGLLARYRLAYEAANGRKAVVMYYRHRYQIEDAGRVCRMRRRPFIEALVEIERRAGMSEEIERCM